LSDALGDDLVENHGRIVSEMEDSRVVHVVAAPGLLGVERVQERGTVNNHAWYDNQRLVCQQTRKEVGTALEKARGLLTEARATAAAHGCGNVERRAAVILQDVS
jgi:hypothetical protein